MANKNSRTRNEISRRAHKGLALTQEEKASVPQHANHAFLPPDKAKARLLANRSGSWKVFGVHPASKK